VMGTVPFAMEGEDMSDRVRVPSLPECDIHKYELNTTGVTAHYDGKTVKGPWAYMCEGCFTSHGIGLGTGRGQRLYVEGEDMNDKTVRVLIVYPDLPAETKDITAKLKTFQEIVGGYIEGVSPVRGTVRWHAYCNEEGKLQGLPINRIATNIAVAAGWTTTDLLVGPVVFLGDVESDDEEDEGGEADVPQELVDLLDVEHVQYRVEILATNEINWATNQRRFDTIAEAETHARDLYSRWMLVEKASVVPESTPYRQPYVAGEREEVKL